jgi:hypothetical protein
MKNRIVWGIICLVFLLAWGIQSGAANEPTAYLALVVEITGEVFIQPKDTPKPVQARWGNYVYQGDFIKTGANAHVSLLFSDGTMIELSENSQVSIKQHPGGSPTARTTAPNEKEKVIPHLNRLQIKSLPFQKPEVTVARDGSLRLFPAIRATETDTLLISPRLTTIATQRPEFRWTSPYPGAKYTLTLSDTSGKIASYQTGQTRFQIPDTLAWGKSYLWTINITHQLMPVGRTAATKFRVIEKEKFVEYQELLEKVARLNLSERDPNYNLFIMGYTYLKYDLLENAIGEFQQLAGKNPAAPFPHEALCRLFFEQQQMEKARQEYQTWCHLLKDESWRGERLPEFSHE